MITNKTLALCFEEQAGKSQSDIIAFLYTVLQRETFLNPFKSLHSRLCATTSFQLAANLLFSLRAVIFLLLVIERVKANSPFKDDFHRNGATQIKATIKKLQANSCLLKDSGKHCS